MTTARAPKVSLPDAYSTTQWRDAILGAATEISRVALSFKGAQIGDPVPASALAGMVGAHIPMVGRPSYELSLLATRPHCEALATAVLGMSLDGLPASVCADAIGEIVNMLAGGVKRRLGATDHELGLPVFVGGPIEPTDRLSMLAYPTTLGTIPSVIVIVGPR